MRQQTETPLPIEPHESWLRLDDREIGLHYWAWFMYFVLGKWGVDLTEECEQKSWEQVFEDHDELFRELPSAAFDLDQDDPEGVLLQTAAKFCGKCELPRAGKLIRGFIEEREDYNRAKSEVDAEHARQRKKAEKPRPTAFAELIDGIVSRRPDISESELLGHLISEAGNGLIETVGDVDIVWLDDKCNEKKNKVSGLKDMLYKAKKKRIKG